MFKKLDQLHSQKVTRFSNPHLEQSLSLCRCSSRGAACVLPCQLQLPWRRLDYHTATLPSVIFISRLGKSISLGQTLHVQT